MYTNLEIPYEVVIFLVKEEIWNKHFNNGSVNSFRTTIIGKQKATKTKVENLTREIIYANNSSDGYTLKPEDIYTETIENSDFSLSVSPEYSRIYFNGMTSVFMDVSSSNIKVQYKLSIPVQLDNFIEIITECKYISNGNIHGSYYYLDLNSFRQYRPDDSNLVENIDRVNLLNNNKKTTILTPGHIYLLRNKSKILYLGTIDETRYRTDSSWRSESEHSLFANSFKSTYFDTRKSSLFINLDYISRRMYSSDAGLYEYIELLRGSNISEFIVDWINFYKDTDENIENCLKFTESSLIGVDLGEFLEEDGVNLSDTLNSISSHGVKRILENPRKLLSTEDLNKVTQYLSCMGSDIVNLPDDIKDKIGQLIVKPELDDMFRRNYYKVNDVLIEKIKNENSSSANIYSYIKSFVSTYYRDVLDQLLINKKSIPGFLYQGMDEKLNTLIIESKKAFFK